MDSSPLTVLSASRRTDIPAFYMDWFMEQINNGSFEVVNPYNRQRSRIPATPDKIHTIVFWSKNFGPFIKGEFRKKLKEIGYNLFFNFTINSNDPRLEPRVPPLNQRLNQLDMLCRSFDSRSVNWRFDPICFFNSGNNEIQNNLHDFSSIAARASRFGIKRCITSFMDHYPKIKKRIVPIPGFYFIDPSIETKIEVLLSMEKVLAEANIDLFTCCEKKILEALPIDSKITKSSCIPHNLLVEIYGGNLSFKKDTGQRVKDGCGCMVSIDIGSYHNHPCYHNCLFCYANPSSDKPAELIKTFVKHK
jgi:DNA repair photolyase